MDARPLLAEVGRRLNDAKLDAVLIGNAAAALQGAPVTTVDFGFMFCRTPRNLANLKVVAGALRATILKPYDPASDLYRVVRDDDGTRTARRPRDLAVLDILEKTLEEATKSQGKAGGGPTRK
jgi:hypothetical protein